MSVEVTWQQALAWRMRRHLLDPLGDPSVVSVVRRLCGVQTQVASSAELAVRLRRRRSKRGEVTRALARGGLIKTWAMRGALHLLPPDDGGAFLSLMAAGRSWERPSWQRYFGVTPEQIDRLRMVVREALSHGPLTREELVSAVVRQQGFADIGEELRSGWGTLLKPLAWQGDLCFGPDRDNRVTFTTPEAASPRWAGVPSPEEAAPVAITAYLRAYAPASAEAFGHWLAGGYFGKRKLRTWIDDLGDRVAQVEVEGSPFLVMADDVDDLAATRPTTAVRLLPGFDQYVLGPGTADENVIPAQRRPAVSRTAGWISPVVVSGGVVSGVWQLDAAVVDVTWFSELGKPPIGPLEAEAHRLGETLGRSVELKVDAV